MTEESDRTTSGGQRTTMRRGVDALSQAANNREADVLSLPLIEWPLWIRQAMKEELCI